MSARKRVLFTVTEVAPFITTGGMGQVAGALPLKLIEADKKLDIRVVVPLYSEVRSRFISGMEFIGETSVTLAWRNQYCGVFAAERDGITYYFVDNRHYFDREGVYGHFDDGERFAFFSKAVFSVIELTGFVPDIIHAHDWQTALVPIYLRTHYAEMYENMKSIFTIHNMEYQGKFPNAILGDVFDLKYDEFGLVEYDGCINLMKGALVASDMLTTVSPSYAEELKRGEGFGLDAIVAENAHKLRGVINGIDTELYNPETDKWLEKNYTVDSVELKAVNKHKVQELFGIPRAPRKMLICVISRLVSHKGMDLVTRMIEDLLRMDVQFLLLGTGEHQYELFFTEMALRYPDKMSVNIAYNPELASKIYAGADLMIMPSRSEPCGLAQMTACRYGTVPVVRATGGLKDTIKDCRGGSGNGFVFTNYDAHELLDTVRQAHDLYVSSEEDWKNLSRECMRSDFSWTLSALEYVKLYEELSK